MFIKDNNKQHPLINILTFITIPYAGSHLTTRFGFSDYFKVIDMNNLQYFCGKVTARKVIDLKIVWKTETRREV